MTSFQIEVKSAYVKQQLFENGFCIIEANDLIDIEKLNNIYLNFEKEFEFKNNLLVSLLEKNKRLKRKVHNSILSYSTDLLNQTFNNYKVPLAMFFIKSPNGPMVNMHQDPMIVDQTKEVSYGLWIPHNHVNEDKGTICVLPKSHQIFHPFHCDFSDNEFFKFEEKLIPLTQKIELNKGQALIMDNRLVHFSLPNVSLNPRIVTVIKIAPKNTKLTTCWFHKNKYYILSQKDEFYLNANWVNKKDLIPSGKLEGTTKKLSKDFSFDDIKKRLSNKTIHPYYAEEKLIEKSNNIEKLIFNSSRLINRLKATK